MALPGNHPSHNIQSDYASIFIGTDKAYNESFYNVHLNNTHFIDKYVGPILFTLPANPFPGEPEKLQGYVSTVGHLGKYTDWAPDVTGAGMSFGPEAENASIGEAVERYCGNFIPDTLTFQSESNLTQQAVKFLSQSLFRNLSKAQEEYYAPKLSAISEDEHVRWVNAEALTQHTASRFAPAEAVYLNLTRSTGSKAHFPVVLAGVAAHRTRIEAETSALLELIERDATMRWWYGGIPGKKIVDIRVIQSLIEPPQSVEQWCLLLDSEFAYVVAGCLYDRIHSILTIGFAARHKIDAAIQKSLAEAWQLRRLSLDLLNANSQLWKDISHKKFPFPTKGFQDNRAYSEVFRADFLDMDQLAYNIQFFLDPTTHSEALQRLDGEDVYYTSLTPLCNEKPDKIRNHCLVQLQHAGFDVFSIDLTTPDMASSGFSTVRVLCPNLVGNTATAFTALAHPRLTQVQMSHTVPKFYPMPHS
ncbi:YcaO-like family protein [Tengunoibacter tsumagoiensis]|uniref:YcaO domain-containing protein n=1 Tax=Tengunoibacter tsumagoiensis TaxID=2014871 RepID=A0A401ZUU3_9CHLR|nr:YcaO-like family protein [Tengunoibacter tsumagoiensis]GCE10572.1 hypothetical protein KTT_04310 [Tengunoibacter tsumagoiensis]